MSAGFVPPNAVSAAAAVICPVPPRLKATGAEVVSAACAPRFARAVAASIAAVPPKLNANGAEVVSAACLPEDPIRAR